MNENEYQNKKVLVTGSGGFIASNLTEELLRQGAQVTALVRYNSRNHWGWLESIEEDLRKNLRVIAGDIIDPKCCLEISKNQDIVFHLAALIAIPYSYAAPFHYVKVNVEGTANLLHASLTNRVSKFVHTSTSEVYGTAQYVPIDEKHPLQGQSPYSASKIAADKIAESFHCSFGLPVVTVRPFNTYGPRQSARAIIPTILTQLIAGNPVLKLGSLEPKRDFNFVLDTVQGFLKAALSEKIVGDVVNIGAGYEISIGDLVEKISEITGIKLDVQTESQRKRPDKSEVMRLCSDISKAKEILAYEPRFSLEEGLTKTFEWLKKNIHYYKTDIYNV